MLFHVQITVRGLRPTADMEQKIKALECAKKSSRPRRFSARGNGCTSGASPGSGQISASSTSTVPTSFMKSSARCRFSPIWTSEVTALCRHPASIDDPQPARRCRRLSEAEGRGNCPADQAPAWRFGGQCGLAHRCIDGPHIWGNRRAAGDGQEWGTGSTYRDAEKVLPLTGSPSPFSPTLEDAMSRYACRAAGSRRPHPSPPTCSAPRGLSQPCSCCPTPRLRCMWSGSARSDFRRER